jgi:predicted nucleic acid-binding protein
MKYLLDSNAWIAVFRGRSDSLVQALEDRDPIDIMLCSVVLVEFSRVPNLAVEHWQQR